TEQMNKAIKQYGVELRGGGTDESPFVYRKLKEVLNAHDETIHLLNVLRPIGVLIDSALEYPNNECNILLSSVPSSRSTTFFSCYRTNVLLLCKYLLDNTPHPQISDRKNNKYATFLKEQTILIVRRQYPLKT